MRVYTEEKKRGRRALRTTKSYRTAKKKPWQNRKVIEQIKE
jgi:hypothetical protein